MMCGEWIDVDLFNIPKLRSNRGASQLLIDVGIDIGTQAQLRDDGVLWTVTRFESYPNGPLPIWESAKSTRIGAPWWPGQPPPIGWKLRHIHGNA